jgi:hypothetical protein
MQIPDWTFFIKRVIQIRITAPTKPTMLAPSIPVPCQILSNLNSQPPTNPPTTPGNCVNQHPIPTTCS